MKKFLLFFIGGLVAVHSTAGAVAINKAPSVATKQVTAVDAGASLLPGVLNLVTGVMQLNQKQKALTAECIPTSQEINFVNNIIKEWAKTGVATADEIENGKMDGMKPCETGETYESSVRIAADLGEDGLICYDYYKDDEHAVWYKFPKASSAYYCTDGSLSGCGEKNKKHVSNIYTVFNMVDFSDADYTAQEAKLAGNLIAKIEKCSNAKLSARKKEMWGEFLVGTVGGLGQKTDTATIMQTVSGMANSFSGGGSGLQSLGGLKDLASQFLAK